MPDSADRPLEAVPEVVDLFDELKVPLRRYLICIGMPPQDADDGVQEAFLRLHKHVAADGDRRNLRGWLFHVARNLAKDRQRTGWVRRILTKSHDEALATIHDSAGTPEDELLTAERLTWIRRAVHRLTPQQAECLQLRVSGLRYREISALMGIGISAVGELVQRATLRLKEDFDESQ